MTINELLSTVNFDLNPLKNKYIILFFSLVFSTGYFLDIFLIDRINTILLIDILSIALSLTSLFFYLLKKINENVMLKILVNVMLLNMVCSLFFHKVVQPEFTENFLKNTILIFMVIPMYGLYCGRKYIIQIGLVFLFYLVSCIIKTEDPFLINSTPVFLLCSGAYIFGMYFVFDHLEKLHKKMANLNFNLEQHAVELLAINETLHDKNEQISTQSIELKHLLQTKDKLFSIIAHDLRSPFSSIIGITEIMKRKIDTYDKAKVIEMIDVMHSSVVSSFELLNNLLEWANSQTGHVKFKPTKTKWSLVETVLMDSLQASLLAKKISIINSIPLNLEFYADLNMLQSILRNLISNAIKYSENGSYIELHSTLRPKEIEFSVVDHGLGMSLDSCNSLFSNPNKISTPGTAQEKGTGLGLVLCKEFIEQHGGQIGVRPNEKRGCCFFFTLPKRVE